ncbi:GNAT family N-acetyltransferase [Kutzneria sp. NPDC052558]|uniref:GNAT family N-acetyltransferase n=1 Tax=Kutzneria sp. NPDC052558 TaxID=3364121 RepID=UPI0037C9920D
MPRLTLPGVELRASFVEAMREFQGEGRGQEHDRSMVGDEIRDGRWETAEGFAEFVTGLRTVSATALRVPCTTWWWCEGTTYLGRIALRHELTERLRVKGGHIGYDVRPTARRRGHATAMLAAVLPKAQELGLAQVLITCDEDNEPSRRVIEANGGVLEFRGDGIRRYWVAT